MCDLRDVDWKEDEKESLIRTGYAHWKSTNTGSMQIYGTRSI